MGFIGFLIYLPRLSHLATISICLHILFSDFSPSHEPQELLCLTFWGSFLACCVHLRFVIFSFNCCFFVVVLQCGFLLIYLLKVDYFTAPGVSPVNCNVYNSWGSLLALLHFLSVRSQVSASLEEFSLGAVSWSASQINFCVYCIVQDFAGEKFDE